MWMTGVLTLLLGQAPAPGTPASTEPSLSCPHPMRMSEHGCVFVEGRCDPVLDFGCRPAAPVVAGGLSRDEILVTVRRHAARARRCARLAPGTTAITMRWTVLPSGWPVDVAPADGARTPASDCLAATIGRWRFARAASPTPVTLPMRLQ